MPEWITDPRTIIALLAAIGGIGYWIGQVNSDRKSFKEFMKEIKDDISGIRDNVQKIFERLGPPTAASASPAQLTEFGERVAKGINAYEWATDAAGSVLDADRLLVLEPFQIEAFCENYVEQESQKEGIVQDKVQMAIYEYGIERERALPVLRIPLREALLKRRSALM